MTSNALQHLSRWSGMILDDAPSGGLPERNGPPLEFSSDHRDKAFCRHVDMNLTVMARHLGQDQTGSLAV